MRRVVFVDQQGKGVWKMSDNCNKNSVDAVQVKEEKYWPCGNYAAKDALQIVDGYVDRGFVGWCIRG